MPSGPCPTNLDGELTFPLDPSSPNSGGVSVKYHAIWDGTSVRDSVNGCVGSFSGSQTWLRVTNTSTQTMYAHFTGRKGTPRTVTLTPGIDQTITNPQLRNNGFDDTTDLFELVINATP